MGALLATPAHPDDEGRRPCTFFMLSANFVRNFPRKSLPFFQELRDKYTTEELVEVALDYADVVKGTKFETTVAGSHRWMQPNDPDPDGEQLKALKGFLNSPDGQKIERVWIDSACMPQDLPKGSRSAEDAADFKRMLKEVNRLYLGSTVLILLDLSCVSHFWTQFESWLAMQFAMPDSLKPGKERHHIVCTQNAGPAFKTALVNMWAAKTPEEVHAILKDVSWSLTCDGLADNITGGAPHGAMHAVPPGTCTLEMVHGWTGTMWSAPGWTDGTFTVSSASYPPVVEPHHALTDELYKTDKPLADETSPFQFLSMNVRSAPGRAQLGGQLLAASFLLLLGVCGVLLSEWMWLPRFGAASRRSNSGRLARCRTGSRHGAWLHLVALLPLACALSPSPPSQPTSPPPPLPPPLMITGGCAPRSSALDNVEYVAVGYTFSGAPYFRDASSSYYIYWDPSCSGTSSTARWIVDSDEPSTTASSDLDGDGKCKFKAHIDSDDSSSPPLGTATWWVACDGSWTDNDLTLAFLPPPPPAPPAPPPWPPGRAPLPPPPEPPALPPADCDAAEMTWRCLAMLAVPAAIFGLLAVLLPTASQPKLFLALYLPVLALGIPTILVLSPLGFSWLVPEQCDYHPGNLIASSALLFLLLLISPPRHHLQLRKTLRARIAAIEGDLPGRLADGSLRLLRVAWLLERPTDWVILRQQDLPEEAFWAPADAARLLPEEKVAALSYKWQGPFNSSKGGGDQPDGSRFHLEEVLSYYREGRHAEERPALIWDFAAIPQHDPITGAKRTAADTNLFKKGLGVMSNAYASPRVLVLQHRRIPLHLERELNEIYDGAPPDDRLDLIPYAGAKCRSGWCTFETACALLMTEGGGHAYELGVGRVPVARGRLPSVRQMKALFEAESTRFIGRADREEVCGMYLALRKKLEQYDEEQKSPFVRIADKLMTGEDPCLRIFYFAIPILALVFLPFSRILRAHLAAVLGCRPRDSLDYTFRWSLCKPPFRRKLDPPLSELPSCFLPTEQGEPAPIGLKSMSSMFAKVRLSQARASKLEREEGVSEAA